MAEFNRNFLVNKYPTNRLETLEEIDLIGIGSNSTTILKIDLDIFKGLKVLKILRLDNNKITEITGRLFSDLSNLKELSLSNNSLKKIDSKTFKGLKNLETLKLDKNEIKEIDGNSFSDLSNLKELDLESNKLERIYANTFIGLSELKRLHLNNNVITEIDVILKNLISFFFLSSGIKLEELSLSNNKLKADSLHSEDSTT